MVVMTEAKARKGMILCKSVIDLDLATKKPSAKQAMET